LFDPNYDTEQAEALLAQHNDDSYIYYLGKVEKRKYKVEKRILIVSSHKLYCMKPSGKVLLVGVSVGDFNPLHVAACP
jgi:hypothetical protein